MVHFVGAGPGDADLITVKGARLIADADVVIYAGSLVNPALLGLCRDDAVILNSAKMTLEEVIDHMKGAWADGRDVVRLHTGDPCLYGAIREQMDLLAAAGIPYDDTPGVSSFCGAAAALGTEYTMPGISQSVIITRLSGRTSVPERESLRALASHGATMVVFLSAGMTDRVSGELLLGGAYTKETPAAIVYKATWPEEKIVHCTVGTLGEAASSHGIRKTALILVGDFLAAGQGAVGLNDICGNGSEKVPSDETDTACRPTYERSRLYDPAFETEFRKKREEQ